MIDLTAFGEVLWDDYGSEKILGGAPLNVCVQAKILGAHTCMLTAVGNDENGQEILPRIADYGVQLIHQVNEKPTGRAEVTLDETKTPHFYLEPDSAYDAIIADDKMLEASKEAKVFYFGSLAQRQKTSRETLMKLLDHSGAIKVYDINLRKGIEDEIEILEKSLPRTDVLKVNEEEFQRIRSLFTEESEEESGVKALMSKFGIQKIFITRDAAGATLYADGERFNRKSPEKEVIDTVGCGDAFTASVISSLLKGESNEKILENAIMFSSNVATYKGATPEI